MCSLLSCRICCMCSVSCEDFHSLPITAGDYIHEKTKGQHVQSWLFWLFLPANATHACVPQVRSLQTDGPLGCSLQGQHASVRGRREPELSQQLPVEVQLQHSDLDAGSHTPRLQCPWQDPPLLHRAGPQLQVQQQQLLFQLRTPTQAAVWASKALQEQVLPCPAQFSGIRGSYRAGDIQPGPMLRQQNTHTVLRTGQQQRGAAGERLTADRKLFDLWEQGFQE